MNLLALAVRNVQRHAHRSMVTIAAMAFAGAIMILYAALMEGLFLASERNALGMNLGDIQIHAKGYRDDPDLYTVIKDADHIIQQLQEDGLSASPRLFGFALAAAGTHSSGVQLRGINPQQESTVTLIHHHLATGQWLSADDPYGVILGRKLARTLNVQPGDELVIVGQAADGSMANDLYRVRGVLKSVGEEVDRGGFYMLDSSFRTLLGMDKGVHEIVILRSDRNQSLEKITATLQQRYPEYETLDWRTLQPLIAEILSMSDMNIYIMLVITYVAVAMVVLNAMLMSVFERIREFGVMKAIGFGPMQLVMLIYAETLVQVIIAVMLAALFGVPLAIYFESNGIDLTTVVSGVSFAGIAIDPVWRAEVTQRAILAPLISMGMIAAVAVIYPAVKAALIRPVKAIHYV